MEGGRGLLVLRGCSGFVGRGDGGVGALIDLVFLFGV